MWRASFLVLLACVLTIPAAADDKPGRNRRTASDEVIVELRENLAKAQAAAQAEAEAKAQALAEALEQRREAEMALKAAEQERARALQAQEEAEKQRAVAEQLRLEAQKRAELAEAARAAEAVARKQAEAARRAPLEDARKPKGKTPGEKPSKRARRKPRTEAPDLSEQIDILNKKIERLEAELDALRLQIQKTPAMKKPAAFPEQSKLSPATRRLLEDYVREVQGLTEKVEAALSQRESALMPHKEDIKKEMEKHFSPRPDLNSLREEIQRQIDEELFRREREAQRDWDETSSRKAFELQRFGELSRRERTLQQSRDLEIQELCRKLEDVIRETHASPRWEWDAFKKASP